MSNTLYSDGLTIPLAGVTGGYTGGTLVAVGTCVAMVHETVGANVAAVGDVAGVRTVTKTGATDGAFTAGAAAYLTTGGNIVSTKGSNPFAGTAWGTATTAATSVLININWGHPD